MINAIQEMKSNIKNKKGHSKGRPSPFGEGLGVRPQTRKNFLLAGLSLAAAFFWKWRSQPAKNNTVKFLDREGRLVEVDATKLSASRRPATKEDVQGWVARK